MLILQNSKTPKLQLTKNVINKTKYNFVHGNDYFLCSTFQATVLEKM